MIQPLFNRHLFNAALFGFQGGAMVKPVACAHLFGVFGGVNLAGVFGAPVVIAGKRTAVDLSGEFAEEADLKGKWRGEAKLTGKAEC